MLGNRSFVRHAVAAVIVIAGAAGWIFALFQTQELNAVKSELGRLASVEDDLSQAQLDLGTAEVERDQCEMQAQTDSNKAKSLESEIEKCQADSQALQEQVQKQQDFLGGGSLWFQTVAATRVRAGPSTDTDEVVVVPAGKTVQVFEAVEDGTWYKVGGIGYIFHELLKPVEKAPAE